MRSSSDATKTVVPSEPRAGVIRDRPRNFPVLQLSSPALIVIVALVFRMVVLFSLAHGRVVRLSPDYVNEGTCIASSIASGHGFASPLRGAPTGPTAWVCPIFPYLEAGTFRIWGAFTPRSLLALQILNCIFASLTVIPIYAAAKRTFCLPVGAWAAWVWAFLPFAWWTPLQEIWDASLAALLLTLLIYTTLVVRGRTRGVDWIAYGVLWAVGALVNATLLSVFPFLLGWAARDSARRRFCLRAVSISLATCALALLPWTIRNHAVFGKWIPLRSNFGLELWLGNNATTADVNSFSGHPFINSSEAAEFHRLGEGPYVAMKQGEALAYMRAHPAHTADAILHRVVLFWTAVTDRPGARWSTVPSYLKVLGILNGLMICLTAITVAVILARASLAALPYLLVLLVFPVPYYLTHSLVRYRFPVEPVITIMAVLGFTVAASSIRTVASRKNVRPPQQLT